ncbi:MOSC domain-containing protein [Paenibacillus glycanilyticus]|uniref:MOSC domain-containing protein n=1 Tax=Paenibacillus glycanilyticus TaxID=126569 RepID=A0ABQ6NPS1_9BACL|nr:MOSC domain-containing protein [Paenibacillus glycanilyticus]GMK46004.1 MOSC domain-containing protein [Paenibacillus glycanilyticus]
MSREIINSRIVSLNVGTPVEAMHGSKPIQTGIYKTASRSRHYLSKTGLTGDGQADLVNHGGPDKAVCVYFERHFPHWEEWLGDKLSYGAFGENWTVSDWTEHDLCIGDVVQAGEAVVQVSQPRQPCFKLGIRHQRPELAAQVQQTGYTGFYFRVLKEGEVGAGENLKVLERHPAAITLAEANRVMYKGKADLEGMSALLAVEELSDSWKQTLSGRIERLRQETLGGHSD